MCGFRRASDRVQPEGGSQAIDVIACQLNDPNSGYCRFSIDIRGEGGVDIKSGSSGSATHEEIEGERISYMYQADFAPVSGIQELSFDETVLIDGDMSADNLRDIGTVAAAVGTLAAYLGAEPVAIGAFLVAGTAFAGAALLS